MFWKQFLLILVMAIIALVIFNVAKPYIFTKFNFKRRYIFIFLMALLILPMLFPQVYTISIVQYAHFITITLAVLIYMEVIKIEKYIRNKPVVGRPKSKPNKSKDTK